MKPMRYIDCMAITIIFHQTFDIRMNNHFLNVLQLCFEYRNITQNISHFIAFKLSIIVELILSGTDPSTNQGIIADAVR